MSKQDSIKRVAARIMQDLAGVQTWVNKTRQDQIDNDTNYKSEPSTYEDGKPRRDRVLPLPDGHPEGRDEIREGPGVFQTPPNSSGYSGNKGVQVSQNALPNQPDGKPLHQRPRSSGMPGDQYGHPYVDAKNTTGIARRPMVASEEEASLRGDISLSVHRVRQREQKGQLRYETKRDYQRQKRRNNLSKRNQRKRWYRANKTRVKRRMQLYRSRLPRHKRFTGGGVSSTRQKNERSEKRRKKAMMREAVRDVMSAMYRQFEVDYLNTFEDFEADRVAEDVMAVPKIGPGSRSTRRQVMQRAKRRRLKTPALRMLKKKNRLYYKRNKNKIKRRVKTWRKKNKSKLKRWTRTRKYASSYFTMPRPLPCMVDGLNLYILGLSPCTGHALMSEPYERESYSLPLNEFYYSAEWESDDDEEMFDSFIEDVALMKSERAFGSRVASSDNTLPVLQLLLGALRGAHWSHWTSHWQVKGDNSYGDHQLISRIYEALIEEIDTLAEKIVGMYG